VRRRGTLISGPLDTVANQIPMNSKIYQVSVHKVGKINRDGHIVLEMLLLT